MTEQDPVGQQDAQARLQQVVEQVRRDNAGSAPTAVRARLDEALTAAGLPLQPDKWTEDTAAEIAAGRSVVVDRRLNGHGEDQGPADVGRTAPDGTSTAPGPRSHPTDR